jgi:hypothetical protein
MKKLIRDPGTKIRRKIREVLNLKISDAKKKLSK